MCSQPCKTSIAQMPYKGACNSYCTCTVFFSCFLHNRNLLHEGGCPAEQDTTCSNVSAVTWPVTPAGSIASISCPCGVRDPMIQQLTATRRCGAGTDGGHGVWEEPQCDSCMFSATTLALCELTEVRNNSLNYLILIYLSI